MRTLQVRLVEGKGCGGSAETLEAEGSLELRFVVGWTAFVRQKRVFGLGLGEVAQRLAVEVAAQKVQIGRAFLAPRSFEKTRALGESLVVAAEPPEQLDSRQGLLLLPL